MTTCDKQRFSYSGWSEEINTTKFIALGVWERNSRAFRGNEIGWNKMIKSCIFHTPIAASYFRNNRSTRQKSLRCFPMCSIRGHVNGGFCGQSIRTTVTLSPQTQMEENLQVVCFFFLPTAMI